MKNHVVAFALATSMAATGAMATAAQAADGVDHQNSVSKPGKANSGPGVQGAPDTRTGPSTRTPGGGADSATEGTSSGATGTDGTTQPSQDSSGVQGPPDTRTGPSTRTPGGAEGSSGSTN